MGSYESFFGARNLESRSLSDRRVPPKGEKTSSDRCSFVLWCGIGLIVKWGGGLDGWCWEVEHRCNYQVWFPRSRDNYVALIQVTSG